MGERNKGQSNEEVKAAPSAAFWVLVTRTTTMKDAILKVDIPTLTPVWAVSFRCFGI